MVQPKPSNAARAQQDLELWTAWKADPDEDRLIPLMESLRPLIKQRVADFRAAPVPEAAVLATANEMAMKAIRSYNPNSGAQLKTWVVAHLKGVHSEVSRHQNMGRIPYRRSRQIGAYNQAVAGLTEELGYEPDAGTIADRMNESLAEVGRLRATTRWKPAHVETLQVELGRSDLIESRALETDKLDDIRANAEREVMRHIYLDLTPRERTVFEFQHGLYGRPALNVTQTAKEVKLSAPTVTRIRQSIQGKIDDRMRKRGV